MKKKRRHIFSAARRGMIVVRIHQLSKLSTEIQNIDINHGVDEADLASRLIEAAVSLRLLVTSPEDPRWED